MRRIRTKILLAVAAVGVVVAMAGTASADNVICVDLHVGIGNIGWHPPPFCIPTG